MYDVGKFRVGIPGKKVTALTLAAVAPAAGADVYKRQNYNSVIPQNNPYKVTVDRLQLLGALRRVSIFSSQASSLIKLRMQENLIVISAQDIDWALWRCWQRSMDSAIKTRISSLTEI